MFILIIAACHGDGVHADGERQAFAAPSGHSAALCVGTPSPMTGRQNSRNKDEALSWGRRVTFNIQLNFRGNRLSLSDKDFAVKTDDHLLRGEIRRRGITYAEKAETAAVAKRQGHKPEHIINYILPRFDKRLDGYAAEIEKEPIPAEISFNPYNAKFTIAREAAGYKIDRENLYARLLDAFIKTPEMKLTVKTVPVRSEITVDYWQNAVNLKSVFSTGFASSSPERKDNIALSAARWNGLRIEPCAEASFNKIVGPRTVERGFKESVVIMNKQFEKGVGGGVCQTSTTIYNAALLAGMEITAAENHSLPVGYVRPSFDAAVSSEQDMSFRNTGGYPVFIRTYCRDNRLYVEFYGEKNKYRIERRSEKLSVIPFEKDETIVDVKGEYLDKVKYKGETARIREAKDGLISKGYLRYYDGKKLVKETLIRKDKYAPQNGLTVEGNLPLPSPPVIVPPIDLIPENLIPILCF